MALDWIHPDWPAPPNVRARVVTRKGGVSEGCYASLNLGLHVGDDEAAVAANRARLRAYLPQAPVWLEQVHGTAVADAAQAGTQALCADASVSSQIETVCAVMTADCLPVLLCDRQGTIVAAAHAGWRGLCNGVLEAAVHRMAVPPDTIIAWLGPAIGPAAFEVGEEVRAAFMAHDARAATAFSPGAHPGKWRADIFMLARMRLSAAGVVHTFGGGICTYADPLRFFSYRRDGVTGRFASLIWLAP